MQPYNGHTIPTATPLQAKAFARQHAAPAPKAAMPLFAKPYVSEITNFLEDLKAKNPALEHEQRAGRALLWDKTVDREAARRNDESRVEQQAYVYDNHSAGHK